MPSKKKSQEKENAVTEQAPEPQEQQQPSWVARIAQTRLAIQKAGENPNTMSGLAAWPYADELYDDLNEKDNQSEFVREWYAAIQRSNEAELASRGEEKKSRRSPRNKGVDKDGNPTNSALVEDLEKRVAKLWENTREVASSMGESYEKLVDDAQERAKAVIAEAQESAEVQTQEA